LELRQGNGTLLEPKTSGEVGDRGKCEDVDEAQEVCGDLDENLRLRGMLRDEGI
jgi:hypothetical protein